MHNNSRANNSSTGRVHEAWINMRINIAYALTEKHLLKTLTTREEMKGERRWLAFRPDGNNDGVTRVVSTSASSTDVDVCGEDVNKLAFALVAPLSAEHHRHYIDM
jgi:hypothetical protein